MMIHKTAEYVLIKSKGKLDRSLIVKSPVKMKRVSRVFDETSLYL